MKKEELASFKQQKIKDFLTQNADEIFTLSELLGKMGLTKSVDCRTMRKWFGPEWCCFDSVQKFRYYGAPETIKSFVESLDGLHYEEK